MLNLEWFRTFKAIYEAGNLTAAAQRLFISQPGVSLHLSSLEAYTGYTLFNRETRKMTPTERGIILYNSILDPIEKLVEAEEFFFRKSKVDRPTLSVGMGFENFKSTLEEHIGELPFNLIMRFGEYPQMLDDLEAGKLDLLLTPQKSTHASLEFTPFTTERIVLVCGSKTDTLPLMALNEKSAIRNWLRTQVWYTTTADMEYLRNFWITNFDSLPDVKPNYIVPYFSSILGCLRNGNGFAVMPDSLCAADVSSGTVRIVWQNSLPVQSTLYFARRKKTFHLNEIKQLEQIIIKNQDALMVNGNE